MHGVFVLDKPVGISSATAVAMVKRCAGGAKTGHAGTLDPLASGVLVLALGNATKIIDQLMAGEKRYRTAIDLSAFTTTDDTEGERTQEFPLDHAPSQQVVSDALARFTGEFLQRPPAFSAVKVAGRRAYAIARGGGVPEIEPRPVYVHELALLRYEFPIVELEIRCAKGFYVRSLARDLGEMLGSGGFCRSIRRTAVGPFTLAMAKSPDDLPQRLSDSDLITMESALASLARPCL